MNLMRKETLPNLVIPLLVGLTPAEVADVLAQGRTLKVAPKTRICNGGDRAERLFIVLTGRVKYSRLTTTGDEIILRMFTPGESFGLATLLPHPPNYLGTAEALFAGELLVWNRDDISHLSDRYHQIKINALRIALLLLGTISNRHASLFEGSASRRVARALIDLGRRSSTIHSQGIDVHITNEQLGALADVSRFTASRVLSGWKKAGVITKERQGVRIHSPEGLLSCSPVSPCQSASVRDRNESS
jgi:CRP-like cAMP-binding protein